MDKELKERLKNEQSEHEKELVQLKEDLSKQ